jgi:hypothetical protein
VPRGGLKKAQQYLRDTKKATLRHYYNTERLRQCLRKESEELKSTHSSRVLNSNFKAGVEHCSTQNRRRAIDTLGTNRERSEDTLLDYANTESSLFYHYYVAARVSIIA